MKDLYTKCEGDLLRATLPEEATVEGIGALAASLRGLPAEPRTLILDLSGLRCADMTLIQLICSLHKSCLASGRELRLEGAGPSFRDCLETNSLSSSSACAAQDGLACLMAGGA